MTRRSQPAWPARISTALASPWALPVLTGLAFAISLWVQRTIYPGLSWNRDEPVYLWQVEVLRAGHLTAPDGGYPTLFQPWLSASRDGSLFSQYTLGWPLVLLLGALLGSPDLGVALGAALCVAGTWALVYEVLQDRASATISAALVMLSPFFLVQSGLHLSYLFTLGLGLLFLAATRSGMRRRSSPRLLGAGLLLGAIVLTRPFDAVVWGLLAAVPLAIEHRRHLWSLVRRLLWTAAGAAPFVVATLLVNRHLTGHATQFPITAADPLDTFGFGDRRLMPSFAPLDYGPRLALTSTGRNAFWLPFFLAGSHLGLLVAGRSAWRSRQLPGTRFLVGLGLAFPIGYFAFFGTHISSLTARLSAPIYYLPSYVPLCALTAMALVAAGRRSPTRAAVLGLALLAVTVPVAASRLDVNRTLSRANLPWASSVAHLDGPALIVTSPASYLLFLNPFGHNGPDLDRRILYASDSGPELIDLVASTPARRPFLQRADLSTFGLQPSEHPRSPRVTLSPITLLRGDVRLTGIARPPARAGTAVWWLEVDGVPSAVTAVRDEATPIDVAVRDLQLGEGFHTLEVRVGAGADDTEVIGTPWVRQRFYAKVTGGALTVLSPGTVARYERAPGRKDPEWIDALELDELQVHPVGPIQDR